MNTARSRRLVGLFAALLMGILLALPAQAAPAPIAQATTSEHNTERCAPHKEITTWSNRRALEARGFHFDLVGAQASAQFGRDLGLRLAPNPASSAYTASRITEIVSQQPIAQRVKCWQATPEKNVVIEFRVRFDQSATPAGMTENLELWNAPFPFFDGTNVPSEPAGLLTSIGVVRTSAFGQPQYLASVVQDLDTNTFNGLLNVAPMPAWLDAGQWHRVRITLSQQTARIEVAQAAHRYTPILEATLLHPAEPLGFEFSVDNEAFPGYYVPVTVRDGLEVDYLSINLLRAH
jgi:hypothetical protein